MKAYLKLVGVRPEALPLLHEAVAKCILPEDLKYYGIRSHDDKNGSTAQYLERSVLRITQSRLDDNHGTYTVEVEMILAQTVMHDSNYWLSTRHETQKSKHTLYTPANVFEPFYQAISKNILSQEMILPPLERSHLIENKEEEQKIMTCLEVLFEKTLSCDIVVETTGEIILPAGKLVRESHLRRLAHFIGSINPDNIADESLRKVIEDSQRMLRR